MSRVTVLFDGKCRFCIRSLQPLQWLDRRRNLLFVDARDALASEIHRSTLTEDLDDAMFVIDERGRMFRGFFAFRRLMWNSVATWPLLPLFYAPFASFIGTRIYAWGARNRYRFGCATGRCSLPEASRVTARGRT